MRDSGGTARITTANTVPLNAWYRAEGLVTSNATAGQLEVKLFDSPDSTTPTETQTSAADLDTLGGNINQVRFGPSSTGVARPDLLHGRRGHCPPSGYVGPGPVVFHMAAGAPTSTGFTVCSKPVGGTSPAAQGRHRLRR